MRTLKTLLIGGLVTASFASFSAAFADDWTYLECNTSAEAIGGGITRFRDAPAAVEKYNPQSGSWEDRCSGGFQCEVTSNMIVIQNEHFLQEINRLTASNYFTYKGSNTGWTGRCHVTDPPPPLQRQF
ncbi:MAG: hypothetical protein CMK08_12715 [Ponticaulis sp.]|nr:hypothetical protein [Ponticaulis sp.]